MTRYRWITAGLAAVALTASASASASTSSEISAVRHDWAELATASVRGSAATLCGYLTTADSRKYFDGLYNESSCGAAARKDLANWTPAAIRQDGGSTSCAAKFLNRLPAEVSKGLTYLSYRVLSPTDVRVSSASSNYLFEAGDTETWQDVHGRWVVASGLPPLYSPECGG